MEILCNTKSAIYKVQNIISQLTSMIIHENVHENNDSFTVFTILSEKFLFPYLQIAISPYPINIKNNCRDFQDQRDS